jgi:hypothetical protein
VSSQSELHLEVLGTGFTAESRDKNLLDLLRRLWYPFLRTQPPSDASKVTVERNGDGWLVTPQDESPTQTDLWNALILVRNWITERSLDHAEEFVSLHAAVVVRGGQAMLLVGDPWAGKTTLTLRLVERGWSYYSDDVAPIRMRDLRVAPFPKPIAIKSQPWEEVSRYWEPLPAWLPSPSGPFLLPTTTLLTDRTTDASVSLLVFLRFEAAREQLVRKVGSAESLAMSARHARGLVPRHLPCLSRICSHVESVELTYRSSAEAADAALEVAQVLETS